MNKVLSQEEVDALLKGMSGGGIDAEDEGAPAIQDYTAYDFTNQTRVIKTKMPTFEAINDQFMRNFRVTMTTTLRRMVDVYTKPIDICKFTDFSKNLPVPSSLHIFRMEPLRGTALFVIDSRLVFHLVECFLGGSGKSYTRVEGREFTPIEQRLIGRVVSLVFADFERVWHPVYPIKMQYVRSEINPQFARIVHPNDPVVISRFTIEMEDISGELAVCIPFANIEPIKLKLSVSDQKEQLEGDPHWHQQLREVVRKTAVELRLELGKVKLTADAIARLAPGDVISLLKDTGEPLGVDVEGIRKFKAFAGVYKGNKAFQLVQDFQRDT